MSLLHFGLLLLQALSVTAHGSHSGNDQMPVPSDADWATKHMAGKTSLLENRANLHRKVLT